MVWFWEQASWLEGGRNIYIYMCVSIECARVYILFEEKRDYTPLVGLKDGAAERPSALVFA